MAPMQLDTGTTGASLGQNLRFNPKEIKKGKQIANKLWNVSRFISLNDVDTTNYELHYADYWILEELNNTIKKTTKHFDEYQYAKAKNEIEDFFMSKFADYYVEFVKYRLYGNDDLSKAGAVYTLKIVFKDILKMFAPIIPFITEELFDEEKSIHISKWPEPKEIENKLDMTGFENAIEAIKEIRKYKSENKISLGAEIEEYSLVTKVDIEKYGEFIKKAIKVKKLI